MARFGDRMKSSVSNATQSVLSRGENAQRAKETIEAAKTTAKVATKGTALAGKTIAGMIATLGNPMFWIALALVVVLFLGYVVFVTTGRTENADGCYGIGTNSGKSTISIPEGSSEENAENVANYLTTKEFKFNDGKPLTEKQAEAMIGNGMAESTMQPRMQQGGEIIDISNEELLSWGTVGAKAVGYWQFDGVVRENLAKFAIENDIDWKDTDTQLRYMEEVWLNEPYTLGLLKAHGFFDDSKSVADLVIAFEKGAERAGQPNYEKRIAFGEEFAEKWSPGGAYKKSSSGSGKTGGSCMTGNRSVNVSADAQGIVDLAVHISWSADEAKKAFVSPGDKDGVGYSTQEYKDAKKQAEEKGGDDTYHLGGGELYASCDRFVATVLKATGADVDVPWGDTAAQLAWYEKSDKWEKYTSQDEMTPGDVLITKVSGATGHVLLYVGEVNGVDSFAQASYTQATAHIVSVDQFFSSEMTDFIGREYYGFHLVG